MHRLCSLLTAGLAVAACAPPELTLTRFEDYADRWFEVDGDRLRAGIVGPRVDGTLTPLALERIEAGVAELEAGWDGPYNTRSEWFDEEEYTFLEAGERAPVVVKHDGSRPFAAIASLHAVATELLQQALDCQSGDLVLLASPCPTP